MEHGTQYPTLYIAFLYYFNVERDYYECHEVLEELWLEEGRERFYQGLLQVAVSLYHFQNNNLGGATKMMQAALDKLEEYPEEVYMGIQLQRVKEKAAHCLRLFEKGEHVEPFLMEIVDPLLQEEVDKGLRE